MMTGDEGAGCAQAGLDEAARARAATAAAARGGSGRGFSSEDAAPNDSWSESAMVARQREVDAGVGVAAGGFG